MVNFCGVFACGKRGDRDRHLSFFRLPKIRLTEGEPQALGSGLRRSGRGDPACNVINNVDLVL